MSLLRDTVDELSRENAKLKRELAEAVKRERERCVKAVEDAREYCRDREYGKETMLDNMEEYAIARIEAEGGER